MAAAVTAVAAAVVAVVVVVVAVVVGAVAAVAAAVVVVVVVFFRSQRGPLEVSAPSPWDRRLILSRCLTAAAHGKGPLRPKINKTCRRDFVSRRGGSGSRGRNSAPGPIQGVRSGPNFEADPAAATRSLQEAQRGTSKFDARTSRRDEGWRREGG